MSDSSILYPISLYSNLHSSEFLDRPNRRGIYHFTPILSEQISNPAMFLLWYRDRSNSTEQFGDELFWSSKPRRKYRAKNWRLKFLINAFMEDMNPKCNAMIFRMIFFSIPILSRNFRVEIYRRKNLMIPFMVGMENVTQQFKEKNTMFWVESIGVKDPLGKASLLWWI